MNMKKLILSSLFVVASGVAFAAEHLVANDAWIREAPPGAKAPAGYMTLHNHGDRERVLVGASSPAFESVMLHRTVVEGEMSKMVHQHMIAIPAGGMVSFEPNSYHLMMMKPKQPLKAGDKVSVTLSFKSGDTQEVTHQVRTAMGEMGHDMGHGHGHNH